MQRLHLHPVSRLRPHWKTLPLWKSQVDDAITADESSKDLLRSTAKKTGPPVLFPWRHEPDIPPRLQERQRDFEHPVLSYENSTSAVGALTARMYMKISMWDMLFGQEWSRELAEGGSFAFSQALKDIMSNVYEVQPDPKISSSDEDTPIQFQYTHEKSSDPSSNIPEESQLMETKLFNLFADARKSGKDQMQVYLSCKPIHAELHSLHVLPGLNRSLVKTHPKLLKEIEQEMSDGKSEAGDRLHQVDRIIRETGKCESTMFAEIFIWCDEVFRVTDLQTGALLQGYDDGKVREVLHGVRLERSVMTTGNQNHKLGNWVITDIDDLLDGNRWFCPTKVRWVNSG